MRLRLTALAAVFFAGCFSPSYENGKSPCGPNGECPDEYVCAADNHCYQPNALPDLSAMDLSPAPDQASGPDSGPDGLSCGANMHVCNDGCALNTDPATCGTSCTPCPVPNHATMATCDGTSCGIVCANTYHACGGACVSNTDVATCGVACTPCAALANATASCDGTQCQYTCNPGFRICGGACIDAGTPCASQCPVGRHLCGVMCVLDSDEHFCGSSCTNCPTPVNATQATCVSDACAFICNNGYHACGNNCVPDTDPTFGCGSPTCSACASPDGGTASCIPTDAGAGLSCNAGCAAPATDCSGVCTDTQKDNNNCGACGSPCAVGNSCSKGLCCPTGQINCGGACVDPKIDNGNCGACGTSCGTTGTCSNGKCCGPNTTNCGGNCVDTRIDANNCGTCGNPCGGNACGGGTCCTAGQTGCAAGCANVQTDSNNCGTCGNKCALTAYCSSGLCCTNGLTECKNTCVDFQTDVNNCGSCGNACGGGQSCCSGKCVDLQNDPNNCKTCGHSCNDPTPTGVATCVAGDCVGMCTSPLTVCGASTSTGGGSCVNTGLDLMNCGICGNACDVPAGGTGATCTGGACGGTCSGGKQICGALPPKGGGTCTDLQNDPLHCASCTHACTDPSNGGTSTCSSGTCGGSCGSSGLALCGSKAPDGGGACVNLVNDANNCGNCGHICNAPTNGTAACALDNCVGACSGGLVVCGATIDGFGTCIDTKTDVNNCGSCGHQCKAPTGGGTVSCQSGMCVSSCTSGSSMLCDTTAFGEGTCVDKLTDPNNCNSCDHKCKPPTGGTATCNMGVCTGICTSGSDTVCGADMDGNGTCGDLTTDPMHCGACNKACSSQNIATPTCTASICNGACNNGFGDCDNDKLTNGCETDLQIDLQNCGACGSPCTLTNAMNANCTAGACIFTCTGTFANCDGIGSNGCEADTASDKNHCGGCNLACSSQNIATVTCTASKCDGACNNGFADCDNNKQTNGCETNTNTDDMNCGMCGMQCTGGTHCTLGVCT
jgi:hypothetical protein